MNQKDTINHRRQCVDRYKISNGCSICGYNKHPSALCFDHLPGYNKAEVTKNGCSKRTCAGGMYRLYYKKHNVDELLEEIKKCRLLCSNCHMEHTHKNHTKIESLNKISIEQLERDLKNELE